ncbi:hypothetical protein H310_06077 [Aphanomyces invadans]|uniref:Ribosomal RNA adenine methylase transferase N-terminal domain-containing protein n=1 Tax=Aphanomyces invadans TaxID=157072 RepID=A0A024UAF7_9STRA|nr:hypothetical protein H310_06077 [Aphanomyces invadans]ETW02608.1 hypothetical protein H310_06077 [Aphanomyces invadans]|eukprot:XP_008869213.1 hypothetical protein H310_06077 [Aphanomyces invadans]
MATKEAEWSDDEGDESTFMWLEGDSLAPPCQSEYDVVHEILKLANVTANDVVFDLGCGDGRICIAAARKYGASAVGIEIEEHLIAKFQGKIDRYNLHDRVRVLHGDLLDADLSSATVIVTYLLPEALAQLTHTFEAALARGCRIVSNSWHLSGFVHCDKKDVGPFDNVPLYLYHKK